MSLTQATHLIARGILLDIEGTTSSISFVHDVMFPFVRQRLEKYLEVNLSGQEAPTQEAPTRKRHKAGR